MKSTIKIKRVYEDAESSDGQRILVDRLWPRGVKKEAAAVAAWEKEVAPSPPLRTWFGHKPERWDKFREQYTEELKKNDAVDAFVKNYSRFRVITLVYAARDESHNHALVLQEYLQARFLKLK